MVLALAPVTRCGAFSNYITMKMADLSPAEEDVILKAIPSRGSYSAVARRGGIADVVWSHGISQRVLVQFLPFRKAVQVADDLNFMHVDERTGDTVRNWSALLIAWWNGKKPESRLILPFAR